MAPRWITPGQGDKNGFCFCGLGKVGAGFGVDLSV